MAEGQEIEVKTDDFEVEIEPVEGGDAINIVVEAINDGDEIEKDIEAMAENFEFEEGYELEVSEQLGDTIQTDLEQEVIEEVFGDVEEETIPTDTVTELVPEVFFQEESPVEDNNGPSKESLEASTLEEYNEEIANEFEHMEELKEEEEVTNLVDQVTDEAIKLTFDGTEAHVTLPDDTDLEAEEK